MDIIKRVLALGALAFLAGCGSITTDHPVGASLSGQPDASLIGVWTGTTYTEKGEAGYMFISPRKEGGALHAVTVGWSASQPTEMAEFDIVTGAAGKIHFVNLFHIVEKGKAVSAGVLKGYWPFAYQIKGDGTLVIYDHTDDGMKLIEHAIATHHLAGTVKANYSGKGANRTLMSKDIRITSDEKTLDAFFAANADKIFTDSVDTFERVKVE